MAAAPPEKPAHGGDRGGHLAPAFEFLESGRSSPSREMVLTLAETLEVPLRERNALLGAAGFAAIYPGPARNS